MTKLLFISNISKRVGSFSVASIFSSKECGIDYYYASNWSASPLENQRADEENFGIKLEHIDLVRSPFSFKNYKAYKQLLDIIRIERIDYIHCNTPVGGLLGRLAGAKCGVKKVIYQAHGFHFYKGAPIINWLIYYPIERILAHFTDALITINREDYERAKKFHLRNQGTVYYVPGVGINTNDYESGSFDRERKRQTLSFNDDEILVVSAGDLIKRKNYKTAIEAIARTKNDRIHYLICGSGPLRNELEKYASELGIEKQIHFLGYRTDIKEILWASDIYLFTTYQEGLPRSLSEAMACGLPCVASRIRGNIDLIRNNEMLCDPNNPTDFTNAILTLIENKDLYKIISDTNRSVVNEFSLDTVISKITSIYKNEFKIRITKFI